MNKYLMMSAAAALATTAAGSANAGTFSLHLGSYCDVLKGSDHGDVYVGTYVLTTCGYSRNEEVFGIAGTTKGYGKNVNFFLGPTMYGGSEFISLDLQIPFKSGSAWYLWVCLGDSCFIGNEGVLLARAHEQSSGKKAPSVMSKLADVIKQRALKNN